jgi:molybdopterin-synthase adenylyltransferase
MTSYVLVGLGGLGSPLAVALAAADPGARLVLVDDDAVDLSNLQRQILFRTADVGRPKVVVAREALLRRWPGLRVEAVPTRFTAETGPALVHDADVVCDGTDDLGTKFLVNDVCVATGRRFVIGGVLRYSGQVFPVRPGPGGDACYRCLYEEPPAEPVATCAEAGVLGAVCGVVAAWQARAARELAGQGSGGDTLGRVWQIEQGETISVRSFQINRRAACPACGHHLELHP